MLLAVAAAGRPAFAIPASVDYRLARLGGAHWLYTYEVTNESLDAPLREFTVWFDHNLCRNLQVLTTDPPASGWSELLAQPDPWLADDGFYDALSLEGGIAAGSSVSGFSVAFEWLGVGQPASQVFEVVDPVTFTTIYRDVTVPEPTTSFSLVAVAGAMFACRRKRVASSRMNTGETSARDAHRADTAVSSRS
jgi:hypothetical protein